MNISMLAYGPLELILLCSP